MEAKTHSCTQRAGVKIFYSFSITDADLIMKDGKSLEHTGVVPDEIVLPTAQDLAEGRDPALSRAAALAGINLDPVAAGKLFPFEWVSI
jgi:C-terminal processing protease CtpA/Prc